MKNNWIISNRKRLSSPLQETNNPASLSIKSDPGFFRASKSGDILGIDGFILPRTFCYNEYAHLEQHELIFNLIEEKGEEFIRYIKGVFTLILIRKSGLHIYNDHHSVKKYFTWSKGGEFVITGSMELLGGEISLEMVKEHAAIFCVMEHFVDGLTLFKDVTFSGPASFLKYEGKLEVGTHWQPEEWTNLPKKEYSYPELAEIFRSLISNYIEYLKPRRITHTLTAGNDSRMILAGLLNLGIKPNSFNFGNPASRDAVIASHVAATASIPYNNYFVDKPIPEWFESYGRRIVGDGNSMLNIHRAHRYDALELEMKNHPDNEMIFTGDMGGEYIKEGFNYYDYILSKTFRLWKPGDNTANRSVIEQILKERYVDFSGLDMDYILHRLSSMKFLARKGEFNNLFISYYVDASVHHTQDINLYLTRMKAVVTPFMDIDFLNVLFGSRHSKLFKPKGIQNNPFRRLQQFDFHIYITHILAPELSDVPYGKRGWFTAREYLGNKFIYWIKRVFRYKENLNYLPSFDHKEWMREFSDRSLLNFSPLVREFTDTERFKHDLAANVHQKNESYWHNYTNIININYIVHRYLPHQ